MNWPYIAGFFDGEGNISVPLGHSTVIVNITQAGSRGRETLEEISQFIGTYGLRSRVSFRVQLENRQPVYMLWTRPLDSIKFLEKVLPYLRIKRTKAQDVIRFKRLFPSLTTSPQGRFYRLEHMAKINAPRIRDTCPKGHAYTIGPRRRWCRECMKEAYYVKVERNKLDKYPIRGI